MAAKEIRTNDSVKAITPVDAGVQQVVTPTEQTFTYEMPGQQAVQYAGSQTQESLAPYVAGQGYDLGQDVASSIAGISERMQQQEQPSPVSEAARPQAPVMPNIQPMATQPLARQASSMSGMEQAAQVQQQPVQEQQPPQPADRQEGVQLLALPNDMPGMQSSRETTKSIDEAYDTDPIAQSAVESAIMNESISAPVTIDAEVERLRSSNRMSAADRALADEVGSEATNDEDRPWWTRPADRMIRFTQNMQVRPKDVIDAMKSKAARMFKRQGVGNRIYGKMLGLSSLEFQDVGIGIMELADVLKQDPRMLEELIGRYVQDAPSVGMMTISQIADLINDNEIWVATFKPPNNQGQDIQRRRLRVIEGEQRGIFLHNVMAAMYTADYDGDDMEVSLDPEVAKYAKDPMDYMVDIYGKISLNMDFLPIAPILPIDGMTKEEYVRDVILGDFKPGDFTFKDGVTMRMESGFIAPLVNAVIELGDTYLKDDDAQSKAYGKVFREARKFADKMNSGGYRSNMMMSDVCRAIFDSMQRTKYYNMLSVMDGSVLTIDEDAVPKPVTYGDAIAYKILDGMVRGSLPMNFQELKLMLTGFTGNVMKKNASFRFTADVGKMMKMDERLMAGDHFELDVDDNEKMELFFQTTVKFAGSLKMAREIKKAGRSEFYTQIMRESVIREVGFPDRYDTFKEFLDRFVKSYNKHSATINEANLVFLTSMGLSSESSGVVSPIKMEGGDVTLGNMAEPILSIYGTYSVGRVFDKLVSSGAMARDRRDEYFAGNPDARRRERTIEREYDYKGQAKFWVTGKYMDFNLRQFRDENRLIRGDTGMDDEYKGGKVTKVGIRNTRVSSLGGKSDVDAQFEMLLAIADKRTSTASKFNTATFGKIEGEHESEEKTTVRYMSTLLTSVSNALRQGNEVIAPGYYAGIGQRKDLPDSMESHMTSVAKRLANMGWVLRSGDAQGSDQAFQVGAGNRANIYKASPKDYTSKTATGFVTSLDKMSEPERRAAIDSVVRLHPNGSNLEDSVRDLMARDYFQVVGTGGTIDSAFVACYADGESSGTWQAIRVARERGIPVFNAAEYDDYQKWEEDVIDAAIRANMGQLRTDSVGRDQATQVESAINALIMANPDLFMHFNMDSPATFLESSWGKKMLQHADDMEVLGGIYTSMLFDYRMERVNSLTVDLLTQKDTTRLDELWNDLSFAKDELASSSEVWHGIMREFEAEATSGMRSFFQMMRENDVRQRAEDGFEYKWNAIKDAADFWADPGTHTTLRSVIDDLDMDRRTKWNIIADVVRYWEKDAYLKSYEVGYQMEVGRNSAYSLGSAPQKGALTVHNDFEQAFNRWGRTSQAMLREDVDKARSMHMNTPRALMGTIERLDREPWELVSIDSLMYADAILSVYDKTYAQTEKASQNPWTNAIYAALSFQQVGGYMNDIERTDDRLLGLTSAESVTIQDVIHLLANPDEEMTVYGRRGEFGIISRDILLANELGQLSGDIEADIWEFLSREPRIAACIRRHSACVMQNTDGKGYLGATDSISETIGVLSSGDSNPVENTKYLMRDHPGYAGIISLALPGSGLSTRNARHRIKRIEDFLSYELYAAASSDWDAGAIAQVVLDDLGITREALRSALRSDYDTFLEKQGLDAYKYTVTDDHGNQVLESEYDADLTYDYALERVTAYVNELRDSGMVLGRYVDVPTDPGLGGPDSVSAAAFWDTIQDLSGAKTSVSTGIEGSETYKFAEWASHIGAHDGYADIEALDEYDAFQDESWDGAWTNLTNHDGTPVVIELSQMGVCVSMTQLNYLNEPETNTYYLHPGDAELSFDDAREAAGVEEIVVQVPEGVTAPDRSTDTHGTQVASLFAYMVSKRSNGAEAFNLKAKKAGIDGKDSITKKLPGGRYRVDGSGRRVSYLETVARLQDIASRGGIRSAQMELARMMLEENRLVGYEDLSLANYMSIAELMLIEGAEDGMVHLRSLEMLMSAIKYRIGFKVDQMSDEQLTEAVNAIVNDNSENGVGIAMMSESLDALDSLSPKSRSMQHDAIRQSSSIFARNYDLLSRITENARNSGIEPLSASEARAIGADLTRRIVRPFVEHVLEKRMAGQFERFLSGYNIVGVVGMGTDENGVSIDQVNWSVGPSNVLYIGADISEDDATRMCRTAYNLGMTVVCSSYSYDALPDYMAKTAVPMLNDDGDDMGHVLIPCFDARLNGSEAAPYKGRFAIAQVPFSAYVASAEDSTNEFGLGDAEGKALRHLTDNMSMRDNGSVKVTAESLFPNVFKNRKYRDCRFTVGLASGETLRNLIADGVGCTIDYGVVEGSKGFEQRVHDVDRAIERYRSRWGLANQDGMMMGLEDCQPGDIVGWAEVEIGFPDGSFQYVLAPIIPFQLHGVKRQPSRYSVENMGPVDGDNTLFAADWTNRTELTENFVKYFDSSGGANKGMISLSQALDESRTLLDGTPLDIYIAKASTDSRKVGTDRRIKTMISLMALARMHGYNFARNADGTPNEAAFPDNPELRDELIHGRIPTDRWKELLASNVTFTIDDRLDAFIRWECRKVIENGGNPSDYLANVYENEAGELENTHVMWEFEAMFDQGLNYEDGLLRFLSFVNPIDPNKHVQRFCPNGIDDTTTTALFRLYQENGEVAKGYDRGVLQMRVPHRNRDKVSYVWDNVYVGLSFFGEEYSGFSRPNVDGASNFLDGMNTMSMYGKTLDGWSERSRSMWATSDIARWPHGIGSYEKMES